MKAVFHNECRAPEPDLFGIRCAEQPPEELSLDLNSDVAQDPFVTLHNLAGELFDLIEIQGARLGWSAHQIVAFQAPVARIREAAQAAIERTELSLKSTPDASHETGLSLRGFHAARGNRQNL